MGLHKNNPPVADAKKLIVLYYWKELENDSKYNSCIEQ